MRVKTTKKRHRQRPTYHHHHHHHHPHHCRRFKSNCTTKSPQMRFKYFLHCGKISLGRGGLVPCGNIKPISNVSHSACVVAGCFLICFVLPGVLFYGGVEYEGLGNNYSLSQRVESNGSLLFNGSNGVLKDGDGDVSIK